MQTLFKYSNIHLDLFLDDEKSKLISRLLWLSHLQCWLEITKEQWGLSTHGRAEQSPPNLSLQFLHYRPYLRPLWVPGMASPHTASSVLGKEASTTISQKSYLVFPSVLLSIRSLRKYTLTAVSSRFTAQHEGSMNWAFKFLGGLLQIELCNQPVKDLMEIVRLCCLKINRI